MLCESPAGMVLLARGPQVESPGRHRCAGNSILVFSCRSLVSPCHEQLITRLDGSTIDQQCLDLFDYLFRRDIKAGQPDRALEKIAGMARGPAAQQPGACRSWPPLLRILGS